MPVKEYVCKTCRATYERMESMAGEKTVPPLCSNCNEPMVVKFSPPSIVWKGGKPSG